MTFFLIRISCLQERRSVIFPATRKLLGTVTWNRLMEAPLHMLDPESVPGKLGGVAGLTHPEWLPELAQLELLCHRALTTHLPATDQLNEICLNPSLEIAEFEHRNLLTLLTFTVNQNAERIVPGKETLLVWQEPVSGNLRHVIAQPEHLLAIKLIAEGVTPEAAAAQANVSAGVIDTAIWDAVRKGILLAPESRLKRETDNHAAEIFTLQWHLTQACDLNCKHCYDRSSREEFRFDKAISLMQELRDFCARRFVRPQVTFTGGNPLLHSRFWELYQHAADKGLQAAILGNAVSRDDIEKLISIQRPLYYQVSLEGLEQHNDMIRGNGNFARTMEFLQMLTEMGVSNLVMLTLTKANMDQVIPLAEKLEGVTGALAFNRLALFGEGAALKLPTTEEYRNFLETYAEALKTHPVLALKDNLLNCIFEKNDCELFGGCTGFGCGAAFNFLAVLSDGEVHACRKFPSPVGNLYSQSLEEIYSSEIAQRYRKGSTACSDCPLKPVCGGCLAVTASFGLDPLTSKDPYCLRT